MTGVERDHCDADHADSAPAARTASADADSSSATLSQHLAQSLPTAAASHDTGRANFSRSTGLPARMGKATAELKTKVPDCVKDEFVSLAHALGLNESDLLRSLVIVRLYGVEGAERMHSNQLRAAAGIGPEWTSAA